MARRNSGEVGGGGFSEVGGGRLNPRERRWRGFNPREAGSRDSRPWPWRGFKVFGLPAARLAVAIALGVLVVALLAGIVRVLPILLAPGVPARIAVPLARGVLGVSLEVALFMAPSLAWAIASARLVDRGDARALFALGVRPARIVASGWPAALLVAAAAAAAAGSWGKEAAAPGRLVREVVASARAACAVGATPDRPAIVDVPLLGLSWVCFEGDAPRIVGPAPLGGGKVAFAAAAIDVSDDLRIVRLSELGLVAPGGERGSGQDVNLRVGRARLTGLPPIGRASNLGVWPRMLLMSIASLVMAAAAALLVLRGRIASRVAAALIGFAGPGTGLLVFSALERVPTRPLAYLAVPLSGAAAAGVVAAAFALVGARRRAVE